MHMQSLGTGVVSCLMETKPSLLQEQQVVFIADPLSSPHKEEILIKKLNLGSERNRKREEEGRQREREGGGKWGKGVEIKCFSKIKSL